MRSGMSSYHYPLCCRSSRFVNVKQACEIIEGSRLTLYRYMERGRIAYRVKPGGRGRFVCPDCLLKLAAELDELAEMRRTYEQQQ